MSPLSRCFEKPYFSCYFKVSPTFNLTCVVTRQKSHVAIFVIYGCRLSVPQLWCQDSERHVSLCSDRISKISRTDFKFCERLQTPWNKPLGKRQHSSCVVWPALLFFLFMSFKKGSVWVLRSGRTHLHLRGFWIQGHKVRHLMCLKHLILEDQC